MQPIQTFSSPTKPKTHQGTNQTNGLYFPSFTFNITPSEFTGFTSQMPYYYLCPDENFANQQFNSYKPEGVSFGLVNNYSMTSGGVYVTNSSYLLPKIGVINSVVNDNNYYYAGGSYIASNNNSIVNENMIQETNASGQNDQSAQYFGNSNSNNN